MAHSLNIIASWVDEEGAIVVGVVMRTNSRSTIILGPSLNSCGMECVDRSTV